MTIHASNLPNGKLIQPEYPCNSCGEFFTGDKLEEVPWFDRQNGDTHFFLFCERLECQQERKRLLCDE